VRVFLIHGMGRSRASMALLSARLRRAGHPVSSFGYLVLKDSLDDIAAQWADHIARQLKTSRRGAGAPVAAPEPYAIIGHSLGNIITRHATEQLPAGLSRFVMLAPPNNSPVMARWLQENPVFKALTRDGGQKLASPAFYEQLSRPDVPTLIIAGDKGPRLSWLPFDGEHDGLVGLDEARLDGVPLHVVPAMHTFIMNHPQVTRVIHTFLERGRPPGDLGASVA
jgi:pimeloyl-ACP methyl ester carboxylesterase